MTRNETDKFWSKEQCHQCGKMWWWEFQEGMPLKNKWPCGCMIKGNSTLVIESVPWGCLVIFEEQELK